MTPPTKALPLDGGGLGGGVRTGPDGRAQMGSDLPLPTVIGQASFDHDRHSPGAIGRARSLRGDMTASEANLWKALRALKLGIRRQAPMGRYIADFIHHGSRLVIEVDGARHQLPEAQLHDLQRDAWFVSQGYRVHRVSDRDAFGRPWDLAAEIGALITGRQKAGAQTRSSTATEPTPHPRPFPIEGKGE